MTKEEQVIKIIEDHFKTRGNIKDCQIVQLLDHVIDDLNGDSLDQVELVLAIEDEFGIEIKDEAAEKLLLVNDFVQYVEKNT